MNEHLPEPSVTPPTHKLCYGCIADEDGEYAAAVACSNDPTQVEACYRHPDVWVKCPEHFEPCNECGEMWYIDDMHVWWDLYYCDPCWEARWRMSR